MSNLKDKKQPNSVSNIYLSCQTGRIHVLRRGMYSPDPNVGDCLAPPPFQEDKYYHCWRSRKTQWVDLNSLRVMPPSESHFRLSGITLDLTCPHIARSLSQS